MGLDLLSSTHRFVFRALNANFVESACSTSICIWVFRARVRLLPICMRSFSIGLGWAIEANRMQQNWLCRSQNPALRLKTRMKAFNVADQRPDSPLPYGAA